MLIFCIFNFQQNFASCCLPWAFGGLNWISNFVSKKWKRKNPSRFIFACVCTFLCVAYIRHYISFVIYFFSPFHIHFWYCFTFHSDGGWKRARKWKFYWIQRFTSSYCQFDITFSMFWYTDTVNSGIGYAFIWLFICVRRIAPLYLIVMLLKDEMKKKEIGESIQVLHFKIKHTKKEEKNSLTHAHKQNLIFFRTHIHTNASEHTFFFSDCKVFLCLFYFILFELLLFIAHEHFHQSAI